MKKQWQQVKHAIEGQEDHPHQQQSNTEKPEIQENLDILK